MCVSVLELHTLRWRRKAEGTRGKKDGQGRGLDRDIGPARQRRTVVEYG